MNSSTPFCISILIPTVNLDRLSDLLYSLHKADRHSIHYQIVIVFDGHPSNKLEFLKRINYFSDTLPLVTDVTRGFVGPASARNKARQLAHFEFLLFLDDDIHIAPDFFARLAELNTSPGEAYLANVKHSSRLYDSSTACVLRGTWLNLPEKLENHSNDTLLDWRLMQSCALLIPAIIFDELGGFNETYKQPHYEDLEFAMRFKEKGYALRFLKSCIAFHNNYRTIEEHLRWSLNNGYWKRVFSRQFPHTLSSITNVRRNNIVINLSEVPILSKIEKERRLQHLHALFFDPQKQHQFDFNNGLINLGLSLEAESFFNHGK